MLDVLRKKSVHKTILWIVSIVIILSFGFFGSAYLFNNNSTSAGIMYGHNVSGSDFDQAEMDARDQAIMIYGDEFFKSSGKFDLEQAAWDRLILLKEAQKRNIQESDQEVVAYIATLPYFQRNGQFDQSLYEQIVQNTNIFDRSTHDFEVGVRKQLIIKKLLDDVAPELVSNDADLKKEYQKRNEKITLEYVLFNASDFAKNASASDDEIKKFYEERKEQFRVPPSIVLNYVQTKDQALAETLSKGLTPGTDFAAAAKALKLAVQTSASFTQDQPVLPFASNPENVQKFFEMKPGDYSPPLSAPDGWQIVQLKEKNDSVIPALPDIKDKVKETLLLEKGFTLAKPQADKALLALTEALKTKDFKTAATELGLKVEETPAFGRKENINTIGLVGEFQQEADDLNTDKKLSGVIATSQGPAIIYLEKTQKPEDKQFESEKENFKQMLNTEKRNQTLIAYISQLRTKANVQSKVKHQ